MRSSNGGELFHSKQNSSAYCHKLHVCCKPKSCVERKNGERYISTTIPRQNFLSWSNKLYLKWLFCADRIVFFKKIFQYELD